MVDPIEASPAPAAAPEVAAPEVAAPEKPKAKPSIHQVVAEGLKAADKNESTVREHLERRGIVANGINQDSGQPLHDWRRQALLGRFVAQGLTEESRISAEVFEAALHETMHGRL